MGRTNGKLVKFLKDGLQDGTYCNLKWQDTDSHIFSLKLPRYQEDKDLKAYEIVLYKWCTINKRKYTGYSGGKSVIKAAMKKSPYLVGLGSVHSEYYFRFATKAEEKEKRRLQKLKSNLKKEQVDESLYLQSLAEYKIKDEPNLLPGPLSSPSPPSSPSSGYQSGNDDVENMKIEEHKMPEEADLLDVVNDLFDNPDSYINVLNDVDNGTSLFNDIMKDIMDTVPGDNIKSNDAPIQPDLQYTQPEIENKFKPVEELVATEVGPPRILNTYWLCTKKVRLDSILMLICEKQVIQDESLGFTPGQFYLNDVLQQGESYDLQKMFELDGKYFLFLSRNN